MTKIIDEEYFRNYCNTGKAYHEVWRDHTRYDYFLKKVGELNPKPKYVLALGSATGELMMALEVDGFLPVGIELCEWAVEKNPERLWVIQGDMSSVVKELIDFRELRFDVIYSNSLAYLPEEKIPEFLVDCKRVSEYFFYCVSSTDWDFVDEYRVINQPYEWWREQFDRAGWEMHSTPFLWKRREEK